MASDPGTSCGTFARSRGGDSITIATASKEPTSALADDQAAGLLIEADWLVDDGRRSMSRLVMPSGWAWGKIVVERMASDE
ncbi:MAG: hypothetical protein JNM18_19180 [Planctomycetaceae bacterium]|nr:hypothetical protein [Planctomycetaceae bacterium]